jgi:hypothetical protein
MNGSSNVAIAGAVHARNHAGCVRKTEFLDGRSKPNFGRAIINQASFVFIVRVADFYILGNVGDRAPCFGNAGAGRTGAAFTIGMWITVMS